MFVSESAVANSSLARNGACRQAGREFVVHPNPSMTPVVTSKYRVTPSFYRYSSKGTCWMTRLDAQMTHVVVDAASHFRPSEKKKRHVEPRTDTKTHACVRRSVSTHVLQSVLVEISRMSQPWLAFRNRRMLLSLKQQRPRNAKCRNRGRLTDLLRYAMISHRKSCRQALGSFKNKSGVSESESSRLKTNPSFEMAGEEAREITRKERSSGHGQRTLCRV